MRQIVDGASVVTMKEGMLVQKGAIMWYVKVKIWQVALQKKIGK